MMHDQSHNTAHEYNKGYAIKIVRYVINTTRYVNHQDASKWRVSNRGLGKVLAWKAV